MEISALTYINLDSRKDRLKNIQNQLVNCPFHIFKTNGVKISNYSDLKLTDYLAKQNESTIKGQIGCTLAHLNALENLISLKNDPENYSMILEDDVNMHNNFWNILTQIDQSKYSKSDLLFFDTHTKRSHYGIFTSFTHAKTLSMYVEPKSYKKIFFWGAHCYAIKNSFIEKVYNRLLQLNKGPVDMMYFNNFNIYHIQTGLVYQDQLKYTSDTNIK